MIRQLLCIPSTAVILHIIGENFSVFHLSGADAEAFRRVILRLLGHDITLTRAVKSPRFLRLQGVAVIAEGMWGRQELRVMNHLEPLNFY